MNNHESEKHPNNAGGLPAAPHTAGKPELTSPCGRGYSGSMDDSLARKERDGSTGAANDYEVRKRPLQSIEGGKSERNKWLADLERLGNSEAGRGLKAYSSLLSKMGWETKDYARAIFMLTSDTSNEAAFLKAELEKEAVEKGTEEEKKQREEALYSEYAEIEKKYLESLEKSGRGKLGAREDMSFRAIATNLDLWKEMKARGLRDLTQQQLHDLYDYWDKIAIEKREAVNHPRGVEIQHIWRALGDAVNSQQNNSGNGGHGNAEGRDEPADPSSGSGTGNPPPPPAPPGPPMPPGGGGNFWERAEGYWSRSANALESILAELRIITEEIRALSNALVKDPTDTRFVDKLVEATVEQRKKEAELAQHRGELGPWDSRDKDLYAGTAGQAMAGRMQRINDLYRLRPGEAVPDVLDPNSTNVNSEAENTELNAINQSLSGIGEYEEKRALSERRKVLIETIEKKDNDKAYRQRLQELNRDRREQENEYFRDIKRWAGVIVKNSESGSLRNLSQEALTAFRNARDMDLNIATEQELNDAVNALKANNFSAYLAGVSYHAPQEQQQGVGYIPESLEETMNAIARNWSDEGWRTGEEYELIDAEGNFHVKNFHRWMRVHFMEWIHADPLSEIDTFGKIQFRIGWSNLSLIQILTTPRLLQHREVEIQGDAGRIGEAGAIHADWGNAKNHPDLTPEKKIEFITEAWMVTFKHNDMVAQNGLPVKNSREEYLKARYNSVNNNNYTRGPGGGFTLGYTLKLASHQGTELKDYLETGKQGSVGKAIRDGYAFFRYFTELTEHYAEKEHGKITGIKNFDENNAYMSLGEDGASAFLLGVAEGALEQNPLTASGMVRNEYKRYLGNLITKIEAYYTGRDGIDSQKLDELIADSRKRIEDTEAKNVTIRLDTSAILEELATKIETQILRRRLIKDEDEDRWTGAREQIITKKEIREMIRNGRPGEERGDWGMRGNIGEFLNSVMDLPTGRTIRIRRPDGTVDDNATETIGMTRVQLINGRIVSDEEAKQAAPEATISSMSLREIATQFAGSYASDSEFEENFRGKIARSEAITDADIGHYHEILNRRELFGFGLMTKLTNLSRLQFNRFRWEVPRKEAEVILKQALMRSFSQTYGFDDLESEYAFTEVWDTLSQFGISALLNTSGKPKIEQGSAFSRFKLVKETDMGLPTMGGSHLLKEEINALTTPTLFDMLNVRRAGEGENVAHQSMLEIMQGARGGKVAKRWLRSLPNDNNALLVDTESLRSSFLNNSIMAHQAVELLLTEQSMHLDSVVYQHPVTGEMIVDPAKLRQVFDKWWNTFRLVYNENNIDYKREVSVDGQVMDMRQFMFGPKTIQMLDMLKD